MAHRGEPEVRPLRQADIEAVTAIYAFYVRSSAATFDTVPPDTLQMERRWQEVLEAGCPYLVATRDGRVQGYAYARPYNARPAYRWTVEDSVYVAPSAQGRGLGRALLSGVIAATEAAGFRQMVALIAPDAAEGSVALHRALGFREAGRLQALGFKLGRWHDVLYMRRQLGIGDAAAPQD
ncbi:MAG: N-acetyltransferase family protein [Hyphomicrobiaceae bacterium]